MVEILGLTLRVDFAALNATLYGDSLFTGSNSILTPGERADLRALSGLVRRMHGQVEHGQALNSADRDRIYKAILDPFFELASIDLPKFTIDLIGWYGEADPRPGFSLPDYWEKRDTKEQIGRPFGRYSESLAGLRFLIHRIVKDQGVKYVLDEALDSRFVRSGCVEMTPSQIGNYRPIRDGYRELYIALDKDYAMFTKRRCRTQFAENEVGCACGCACECTCKGENVQPGLDQERIHDALQEMRQALGDLDASLQGTSESTQEFWRT
jgi:hypothetical protein